MCKCERNNGNRVVKVKTVNVGDIIASIFAAATESDNVASSKKCIDLDKEIDRVVFNDPATIVFWKDGTKTVTKCHNGDVFNKETGLAMCIVRKLTGNRNYNSVFEKYCN